MSPEPLGGLYVHIPFCLRKCAYCDFYSITDRRRVPEFLNALTREITLTGTDGLPCDTVYFGGGTPSLIHPESIANLLAAIRRRYPLREPAEITLEVNPGTATEDTLQSYGQAGINRLSIGVQSFSDRNLSFLSRIHTADQAHATIRSAREAGFRNIGLDLIYGLPGQSESAWEEDLRQAVAHAPEHLSCYMLSYEPGVPLTEKRDEGAFNALEEADTARLFRKTSAFLLSKGYEHYEVSNFAREPGHRSRHNQKYWSFAPYIGFGPAAHSYRGNRRRWNHRDIDRYLAALAAGRLPMEAEELLTTQQRMLEAIYLGLRQRKGIGLSEFEDRFRVNFREHFAAAITPLRNRGYLELADGACRLTTEGLLLLDSIVERLVGMVD